MLVCQRGWTTSPQSVLGGRRGLGIIYKSCVALVLTEVAPPAAALAADAIRLASAPQRRQHALNAGAE